MRRPARLFLAVLLLLATTLAVLGWLVPRWLTPRLQASLSRSLGCRVELSDLQLHPGGLSARHLRLLDAGGVAFAEADQAWLALSWLQALSGNLAPRELRLGPGRCDLDPDRLRLFAHPSAEPSHGRAYPIVLQNVAVSWRGSAWSESGWSGTFPPVAPGRTDVSLESQAGARVHLQGSPEETRLHLERCPLGLPVALAGWTLAPGSDQVDLDLTRRPGQLQAHGSLRTSWWSGPFDLQWQPERGSLQAGEALRLGWRHDAAREEWVVDPATLELGELRGSGTARLRDRAHWNAAGALGPHRLTLSCQGEQLQAGLTGPALRLQLQGSLRFTPLPVVSARFASAQWNSLVLGNGALEWSGDALSVRLDRPVRAGDLPGVPSFASGLHLGGFTWSHGQLSPQLAP